MTEPDGPISAGSDAATPRPLIICGAGGRDFHNFNVLVRDDPGWHTVAFTGAQIPGIDDRRYPTSLAGPAHPRGIPIVPEAELGDLCRAHPGATVMFAYSDVRHEHVMHLGSRALAAGADFWLPGPDRTMLQAARPVIAVSAVRTGCGKSQIARHLSAGLRERGLAVAVLRHPMPYGNLHAQRLQRFASVADIDAADCTIEEREEYEPHVAAGNVVFAGVDYAAIAAAAARDADVLLWDGGNNDFPFLAPDLHVVVVDALRPEHVTGFHPGEAVLGMADVIVIAKTDAADADSVAALERRLNSLRPGVPCIRGASPVRLDDPAAVAGRSVVVVDDGPTLTHGGMGYGAGYVAARAAGARIVDPRPHLPPGLAEVFERHPQLAEVLPAVGYDPAQRAELKRAILACGADLVVAGTPVDLGRVLALPVPVVRARYEYADAGRPTLLEQVDALLTRAEIRPQPR